MLFDTGFYMFNDRVDGVDVQIIIVVCRSCAHLFCGEVGVHSCVVSVARYGFGIQCGGDIDVFINMVE